MAVKHIEVPDIGMVYLHKRKNVRNIRLSITSQNQIRISLPLWMPYAVALRFLGTKKDWVKAQMVKPGTIGHLDRIGKSHHISFEASPANTTPRARSLPGGEIRITYPELLDANDPLVQAVAQRAALRALKQQATLLLIPRIRELARTHGFIHGTITIKRLKSRWGSCSSHGDIVLNSYLMQLPWHLIDYVLLHELTHTQIMAHGPKFWKAMGQYVPNLAALRKEIRTHRPILTTHPAKHKL